MNDDRLVCRFFYECTDYDVDKKDPIPFYLVDKAYHRKKQTVSLCSEQNLRKVEND